MIRNYLRCSTHWRVKLNTSSAWGQPQKTRKILDTTSKKFHTHTKTKTGNNEIKSFMSTITYRELMYARYVDCSGELKTKNGVIEMKYY